MILTTSYLPPIWYIELLISADAAVIEGHEHFVKQTIRNRCHILSPNGVQTLIVPIDHHNRAGMPIKDIRISDNIPWQRQHWRSLCAAYQRSAFFEFFQDDLSLFYERHYDFLLDYNMEMLRFLLDQLQVKRAIDLTADYVLPAHSDVNDFRKQCDTGIPVIPKKIISYPQVFSYKNGFIAGLSIADLLFSMGPAAIKYLVNGNINQ